MRLKAVVASSRILLEIDPMSVVFAEAATRVNHRSVFSPFTLDIPVYPMITLPLTKSALLVSSSIGDLGGSKLVSLRSDT